MKTRCVGCAQFQSSTLPYCMHCIAVTLRTNPLWTSSNVLSCNSDGVCFSFALLLFTCLWNSSLVRFPVWVTSRCDIVLFIFNSDVNLVCVLTFSCYLLRSTILLASSRFQALQLFLANANQLSGVLPYPGLGNWLWNCIAIWPCIPWTVITLTPRDLFALFSCSPGRLEYWLRFF